MLQTGEVLQVAKGMASLYDPGSGTWSPAAPPPDMCSIGAISSTPSSFTTTLLQDGRVIVAGGAGFNFVGDYGYPCGGTDIFNPLTSTWASTPASGPLRFDHDANVLADGRAIYTGGMYFGAGNQHTVLNTSIFYDPASEGWVPGPTFDSVGRAYHRTILLDNGDLLLTGGETGSVMSGYVFLGTSFLYDPSTNTWSATGSLGTPRDGFGIAKLPDGRVLVSGGCPCTASGPLKSAEIYDPQTGIWSPAPDMSTARANHALLTLGNGLVLAVGGEFSATRSRAEVYDSSSNRWLAAGLLAGDHDDHAVALANGWVLAPADHYDSQVAEIYRPALAHARTDFNADGGSDIVFENAGFTCSTRRRT